MAVRLQIAVVRGGDVDRFAQEWNMELTAMAMTFILSVGLGVAGTRAMLSALFFFMAR
jgi:hypothetical protein